MGWLVGVAMGAGVAAGCVVSAAGVATIWTRGAGEPPATVDPIAPSSSDAVEAGLPERRGKSDTVSAASETPPNPAPRIDTLRIDAAGSALAAGRVPGPGGVRLRLGGEVVAETVADADGHFVVVFDVPPSPAPAILTIEADGATGAATAGESAILIAPRAASDPVDRAGPGDVPVAPSQDRPADAWRNAAAPPPGVAERSAKPVPGVAVAPATRPGGAAPVARAEAVPAPVPPPDGAAPSRRAAAAGPSAATAADLADLVSKVGPYGAPSPLAGIAVAAAPAPLSAGAGPDGVTAMTRPDDPPEALGLDAISYGAAGAVTFAGRAPQGAAVAIRLDGRPIEAVTAGRDGAWSSGLPAVADGVYRLRIDAVDAAGRPAGRVETPFQRTAPAIASAARASGAAAFVVQPGHSLWAISEGWFGDGLRYVRIFDANRGRIRNPDLIYPGQILHLPEAGGAAVAGRATGR